MKVTMFADQFHPELSGIADAILALGAGLRERGHSVDLIVPRYSRSDYQLVGLKYLEADLGVDVSIKRRRSIHYPSPTLQSRLAPTTLASLLGMLRHPRSDIIHVHTFLGLGLEGLTTGRCLGIPVIATNHSALRSFSDYLPVPVEWAVSYVLWFCNMCALVTAPSKSVFRDLGAERLKRPLRIIESPIDTDTFRLISCERKAALKHELGLPAKTICYAGRLAKEKNLSTVLRAIELVRKTHPDVLLVIAGHGSEEETLRRLSARISLDENVRFVGTLSKRQLASLLQASDMFVTMSTSETQNLALLQAMACGLPVIGAEAAALPEFVVEQNGRLVPPEDHAALAEAILLEFRPERKRNSPTLIARSSESLAIRRVARRWEAVYEGVLA